MNATDLQILKSIYTLNENLYVSANKFPLNMNMQL